MGAIADVIYRLAQGMDSQQLPLKPFKGAYTADDITQEAAEDEAPPYSQG